MTRSLQTGGDRLAVIDGGRRLSYRALERRTAGLGNTLLSAGAGPAHPVGVLLGNCLEYVECDIACTRVGAVRVGLSDRLSGEEWTYILNDAGVSVLVTRPDLFERITELPEQIGTVVLVGKKSRSASSRTPRITSYEDAVSQLGQTSTPVSLLPDAPNYILYTSGTTGRPKGAVHSQAGRAAATLNMLAAELWLTRESAMLHCAPLTHGSGSKLIAFLVAGGTNIILQRFDPELVARTITEEKATHTFLVPTMLHRIVESSPQVHQGVRGLSQISFGGSPIAPESFRESVATLGPILTQVYGSCEAPHPVTLLRPELYVDSLTDEILGSAGVASPGVDLKILDAGGAEAEAGAVGELCVRAQHQMLGYWRNDKATAEAFTDGWYLTGDLAVIDDAGFVTFRDRKRDVIITGGMNVYPSEVERVLLAHPAVDQVAVVGYPDDEWGESVLAYVVLKPGGGVSDDTLMTWSRTQLASYKKPRRVEFVDRLPTGPSNKVLKDQLRERLWAGRGRAIN